MTTRSVRSSVIRRAVVLLLALPLLAVAGGCSSTGGTGDPTTLTGGLELDVESRDTASHRIVAFTVRPDGAITVAGGRDALARREGWSGQLSAEQATALRALLERDGWLAGTVAASGEPRSLIFRVTIRGGPDGRQRYDLRGESAEAARLEEFLDQATRHRFGDALHRLPQAGDRIR